MKLKGIKLEGTCEITYYKTGFVVDDEKGKRIYFEDSNGYWEKGEYNEQGKIIYFEDSNGYWEKGEYDKKGNEIYYKNSRGFWEKSEYDEKGEQIYYEDSEGIIIDERAKELTVEEIEKLLGYKIKIKGE